MIGSRGSVEVTVRQLATAIKTQEKQTIATNPVREPAVERPSRLPATTTIVVESPALPPWYCGGYLRIDMFVDRSEAVDI
jgi:hypothetical protein